MNGILGQASGVVGVRVATGNREHALRHQLSQGMIDLAGLSSLFQTGGELVQQSQAVIGSLQQQSAAIRATIWLIKLSHHRFAKNSGNNKHCVVLSSDTKKPPTVLRTASSQRVCSTEGFFCL